MANYRDIQLLKSNRSGQAQSVLSQVQTRHDDIKRIEKTLLELHQLFVDMQTLVEHQGNTLTEIEDHAETAAGDIEKGVHHVDDAIKIAKRTRAVSHGLLVASLFHQIDSLLSL